MNLCTSLSLGCGVSLGLLEVVSVEGRKLQDSTSSS